MDFRRFQFSKLLNYLSFIKSLPQLNHFPPSSNKHKDFIHPLFWSHKTNNSNLILIIFSNLYKMTDNELPTFFYDGQMILPEQANLGSVWLSGLHFASNLTKISENNIVAVVSAVDLGITYPATINHYKLNLKDSEDQQIRYTFFPVFRFIQQQRKKGNVLIHCAAGISRSAALLMAYMMNKYQASLDSCLTLASKKRPCVKPNRGFIKQLRDFSSDLGIKDHAIIYK